MLLSNNKYMIIINTRSLVLQKYELIIIKTRVAGLWANNWLMLLSLLFPILRRCSR